MECLCGWTSFSCFKPKRETREQRARRLQNLKDAYLARDRKDAAERIAQQSIEVTLHEVVNKPEASSSSAKGTPQTAKSPHQRKSKTHKSTMKQHSKSKHSKSRHQTKDRDRSSTEHSTQHSRDQSKKSAKGKEPVRG